MANRRMFSQAIVCSDNFLSLPHTSQSLYFQLGMKADDDGFVDSPRSIARMIGANDVDIRLLIEAGLIYLFDSGIIVVTDWKINNSIKPDRYAPTIHQDEKSLLQLETSKRYRIISENQKTFVSGVEPQYSIGKDSIDKESIEENSQGKKSTEKESEDITPPKSPSKISRAKKVSKTNEYTPEFERFWKEYPSFRRTGKSIAFESWQGAIEAGADPETIILAVRVLSKTPQWTDNGGKYTKMPATWLNQHGWEDVLQEDLDRQKSDDEYWANPAMKPDDNQYILDYMDEHPGCGWRELMDFRDSYERNG